MDLSQENTNVSLTNYITQEPPVFKRFLIALNIDINTGFDKSYEYSTIVNAQRYDINKLEKS